MVATKERNGLAKAQKTIMVPEDMYALVADHERRTGATFTRQAIAAFFAYYFSNPTGPDPRWMKAVIAVENGEVKVGDVPVWLARQELAVARAALKQIEGDSAGPLPSDPEEDSAADEEIRWWRDAATMASDTEFKWEAISKMGDTPIEALLRFWAHVDAGLDPETMIHAVDLEKFKRMPPGSIKQGFEALITKDAPKAPSKKKK